MMPSNTPVPRWKEILASDGAPFSRFLTSPLCQQWTLACVISNPTAHTLQNHHWLGCAIRLHCPDEVIASGGKVNWLIKGFDGSVASSSDLRLERTLEHSRERKSSLRSN